MSSSSSSFERHQQYRSYDPRTSGEPSSERMMYNNRPTTTSSNNTQQQQQQQARHQQQQMQHQYQLEYTRQDHQQASSNQQQQQQADLHYQQMQHQPTLTFEDVQFRNVHHQQGPSFIDDYAQMGSVANQQQQQQQSSPQRMPLFPAFHHLPPPAPQFQPPQRAFPRNNNHPHQQDEEHYSDTTDNAYYSTHPSDQQEEEEEEVERAHSSKRAKVARPASSLGESRLKINFINFGSVGEIRQGYGRKAGSIPDGLCGTNEVYNEQWRFEIKHKRHGQSQRVLIDWRITNLNSGKMIHRTESLEDSMLRETQGKTICNQVLKMALEERAKELEEQMASIQDNAIRIANLQSRIKALRPKRCLIGLLFFGLQHKIVQDKLMLSMKMAQEEDDANQQLLQQAAGHPPLLTPASSTSTFH